MRIIYSVAGRFKQHILALEEITGLNLNLKIITVEGVIAKGHKIKGVSFNKFMQFIRFFRLNNIRSQRMMLNLYDFIVSLMLQREKKIDIFHHYGAPQTMALKVARNKGAKTFLQTINAHVLFDMKVTKEEAEIYNVPVLKEPVYFSHILNKNRLLKAYEMADYIICLSKFAYNTFIQNGIKPEKIRILPLGVDLNRFRPGKKLDDKFRILFVGRVTLQKGIKYLLEAYQKLKLKNAELVIVGPVGNELKEWIRDARNKINFKMVGFTPNPVPFYQNASIFVLPSVTEGCARVILEAMACGLPVIVTTNTGTICEDGKSGFVIPIRDVETLKEKILFLYENREIREEMGKNAREHILKHYGWEKYVKRLINIYRSDNGEE